MSERPRRSETTRLRAGTSGFSYDAWHGSFYPAELKAAGRLGFYAQALPAVEINNTFYRMPKTAVVEGWRKAVPDTFRFVIKASRRITHFARLGPDAPEAVAYLMGQVAPLGPCLGPILLQLPPNFKPDLPRLEAFLAGLPRGVPFAMEFRHPAWFNAGTYDALGANGVALVIAEGDDDALTSPVVATADFGYLRLRRPGYDRAALTEWASTIRSQGWREAYCFFKHEDDGPHLARALLDIYESR